MEGIMKILILLFLIVFLIACGDSKCKELKRQQAGYIKKYAEYTEMILVAAKQKDINRMLKYSKERDYYGEKIIDINYQMAVSGCKQD